MRTQSILLAGVVLFSVVGCGDDGEGAYGYVSIELRRGAGEEDDPFGSTDQINVRLDYLECLANYYFGEGNGNAADGKAGESIFAEWEKRLCDEGRTAAIDCDVLNLGQTLDQSGITQVASLDVEYKINNSKIELSRLYVGPIPTQETVGCVPVVGMNASSVVGLNGSGSIAWEVETYTPSVSDPSVLAPFHVEVKTDD